ncbi:hypothetical protein ACERNI_09330 [Camelimonas sp. ID_303_24]
MTHIDKLFRQIGNNSLGAPIEFWRTAFSQGRNLGNFHGVTVSTGKPQERGAEPYGPTVLATAAVTVSGKPAAQQG